MLHESFDAKEKSGRNQLMASIESFNPSALLVYGWNFDGHLAAMRHFHGSVPVWFRGDSTLLDPLPFWKRTLRKLSLNWVYRFVDRAFYVGQANKRYFLWCGLKEDQLTYAPHAVDNEFFMKDDDERREEALQIRKDLGIDPLATVFLFAGKLEAKKQPLELAEAFASLHSQAHLIYVGSGHARRRIEGEIRGSCQHPFRRVSKPIQNAHLVSGCGCLLFAITRAGRNLGIGRQ